MKKEREYVYDLQKEISLLGGIVSLLHWDEKTHLPHSAGPERSQQMTLLEKQIYDKLTSSKLNKALNSLKKRKQSSKDRLVFSELDKQIKKIRKIPKEFIEEMTNATVISGRAWEVAREKNSFRIFKPKLRALVELKQREAKLLDPKKQPYDVLLDQFEEGMTSAKLTKIFEYLKIELVNILKKIRSTSAYKRQKKLKLDISIDKQKEIIYDITTRMGLTNERASIDMSPHPFTVRMGTNDVRITTRYIGPIESFFVAVHEAGHALYELGLPKRYENTVIYNAASVGMHESQSKFWEYMIGRNEIFWRGYFRRYSKYMKRNMSWQNFYKSINQVRPSMIRVDADEVTYCLHIILRFEIERDLINGKIEVKDVKDMWNMKVKEIFGLEVKDDNDGILQDVHWSLGVFGYFPTYAIGTVYSSQLYKQMLKDVPNAKSLIRTQDFKPIVRWLRNNIHHKGKTMTAEQIVKKACKQGLSPEALTDYLKAKYSNIYGF